MHREFHKWYSANLGRDMELEVYGHAGRPMLVFPCSKGRFFDYYNRGMMHSILDHIEGGRVRLVAVDSIDEETWHAHGGDPWWWGVRYNDYDRYITQEVVPFINNLCGHPHGGIVTTGTSMGAYHAVNMFLKHPYVFNGVLAMSGLYRLRTLIGNVMNENIYYNSPLDYLPNLDNENTWNQIRSGNIVVVVGQGAWEDDMRRETDELRGILNQRGVPHTIDYWGSDVNHDWPWWLKMFPHYIGRFV